MFWQITSFPRCQHHIFLSHCAEDRAWLVREVDEELRKRRIIPWLDQNDYSYGRGSRTSLKDGLLFSRHVVFFVTLGMMNHRRGWCQLELAYSDLLQANLEYKGRELLSFALPLMFLDRSDSELPKSVWEFPRDKARFHHPSDGDEVLWAVNQITNFLRREQKIAIEMANDARSDPKLKSHLKDCRGLFERITLFDPGPIP